MAIDKAKATDLNNQFKALVAKFAEENGLAIAVSKCSFSDTMIKFSTEVVIKSFADAQKEAAPAGCTYVATPREKAKLEIMLSLEAHGVGDYIFMGRKLTPVGWNGRSNTPFRCYDHTNKKMIQITTQGLKGSQFVPKK